MLHTSGIEISRSALKTNLQYIKDNLENGVQLSSVVKANAYGHGIEEFVPLAESCGVGHFAVFSVREAQRVYESRKTSSSIMVMGMIEDDELGWAIERGVEFYVFDLHRLAKALDLARRIKKPARIHLEIETGMFRTGIDIDKIPEVMKMLRENADTHTLEGLCTHYAGSEESANHQRVKRQYECFNRVTEMFRKHNIKPRYRHTACSAAALRYPETQMDMVRIGILQYGFFPSEEVKSEAVAQEKGRAYPLNRLITWKTRVMDIKKVKAGNYIGYGDAYLANSDMTIAIVPVGYGYGYTRSLSNQGRALIHGKRVGVVGMVNMNMMSVDITGIDGVEKGDEVILIGHQGDLQISVSSFGQFSDQLNYELLTRLPAEIPRQIVD